MKYILLAVLITIPVFSNQIYKYNGEAFDLKTGKKLYSDFHEETYLNGKHISSNINYKDPSGKVFAKKKIVFQKNEERADFKLEDFRDGYTEGAEVNGSQIKFIYRKNNSEELKEQTITSPENAVLDGGFDVFIRKNWNEILNGKRLTLNICAPSQMDCFKFAAFKVSEEKWKGIDAVKVRVELNNRILAAFVQPIIIHYEKETKRILQYDGISNINNEEGKSYVVRITYTYPPSK
jgi:hypothetical protein